MSAGAGAARARYRVGQFARALSPWVAARDRRLAAAVLPVEACAAWRRQSAADQRHSARVLRALVTAGARDADLLVAALLHDLGKVDECGRGRVRLPHRVVRVLLARWWSAGWCWAGLRPRGGLLHGCYLLAWHPALGAAWAARLGVSVRACALIAAHEAGTVAAEDEEALRLLRVADERA